MRIEKPDKLRVYFCFSRDKMLSPVYNPTQANLNYNIAQNSSNNIAVLCNLKAKLNKKKFNSISLFKQCT